MQKDHVNPEELCATPLASVPQRRHLGLAGASPSQGALGHVIALNSAPLPELLLWLPPRGRRGAVGLRAWLFPTASPQNPILMWAKAKVSPGAGLGPARLCRPCPQCHWPLRGRCSACPLPAHGPLLPNQSHRRPVDPHGQWNASPR